VIEPQWRSDPRLGKCVCDLAQGGGNLGMLGFETHREAARGRHLRLEPGQIAAEHRQQLARFRIE